MKTYTLSSKYSKVLTFAFIVAFALLPVTAKAQGTPGDSPVKNKPGVETVLPDNQGQKEEKKAEIEAKKEEKTEDRCAKITALVRAKVAKYRDNRVLYIGKFSMLSERISNLITRIKSEYPDLDVTKLEADLATLNEKLAALSTLHEELVSIVMDVQTTECGTGKPAFADAISDGRSALKDIKTAVLDIRTFYLEVIKPDMIDLRQEYKEKLSDAATADDTDGDVEETDEDTDGTDEETTETESSDTEDSGTEEESSDAGNETEDGNTETQE